MRYVVFSIVVMLLSYPSYALEYLSDDELSNLDGYTSDTMLKEYDDEGNTIFRRGDDEACRYGQSDSDSDVRMKCENALENEFDRMMAANFQRYLDQALELMEADPRLDVPGDGVSELNLSAKLENFNYNHFMCDGMPDKGVIRFEGISLTGRDGGDFKVLATTEIKDIRNSSTGRTRRVISSKTRFDGGISVESIRIGTSVEGAKNSPSLGGITMSIESASMELSRTEQ